MTTIVCNDMRVNSVVQDRTAAIKMAGTLTEPQREDLRESINLDFALCKNLREKHGLVVHLFDARADDLISKYTTPAVAASFLAEMIARCQATGMVFDLAY